MLIAIACICFVAGLVLGFVVRSAAYDNQDWRVMRWCKTSLGYRPLPLGVYLHRNDNVIMALKLNTDGLSKDGIQYVEDE